MSKKDEITTYEFEHLSQKEGSGRIPPGLKAGLMALRCPSCMAKPDPKLVKELEQCSSDEFIEMLEDRTMLLCHKCGTPYLPDEARDQLVALSRDLQGMFKQFNN